MKKINFIFSLILSICLIPFLIAISANALGDVDWILLKENDKGKEWLDLGSIKRLNDKELSVLTKFYKRPLEREGKGETSLYVMRINCLNKEYKDTSINGIPKLKSKWLNSNNDELIDIVIERSCSEEGFIIE